MYHIPYSYHPGSCFHLNFALSMQIHNSFPLQYLFPTHLFTCSKQINLPTVSHIHTCNTLHVVSIYICVCVCVCYVDSLYCLFPSHNTRKPNSNMADREAEAFLSYHCLTGSCLSPLYCVVDFVCSNFRLCILIGRLYV